MTTQKPNNQRFPRRSAAQWQTIIQQYTKSGLSVTDFCQQASIGKVSFHKWHNRVKKSAANALSDSMGDFMEITPTREAVTEPRQVAHSTPWDIELDLGDGLICRLRRR